MQAIKSRILLKLKEILYFHLITIQLIDTKFFDLNQHCHINITHMFGMCHSLSRKCHFFPINELTLVFPSDL